jgi:hypothetical protein
MRIALVVVIALFASCDALQPGPEIVCDEAQLGGLRCDEVIEAAAAELGEVGRISRLTVADGPPCPIDEAVSCPDTPAGAVATVYADLADGRRFAVAVHPADDGSGALRADAPQDMGRAP